MFFHEGQDQLQYSYQHTMPSTTPYDSRRHDEMRYDDNDSRSVLGNHESIQTPASQQSHTIEEEFD